MDRAESSLSVRNLLPMKLHFLDIKKPGECQTKSGNKYIKSAIMISAQLRAARAMLDWSQSELALRADLSVETIKRLENMPDHLAATRVSTLNAIVLAFADAGVEFTNGDAPGVRLRKK